LWRKNSPLSLFETRKDFTIRAPGISLPARLCCPAFGEGLLAVAAYFYKNR
jgi:hypothetical protein